VGDYPLFLTTDGELPLFPLLSSPPPHSPEEVSQLEEISKRFTEATKITIRFDHLQEPQMAATLAAEVQTGSGHDILMLRMHLPQLYATNLADMPDVVDLLVKQYGPMYDFCREAAYYKDHWVAMPAYWGAFPGS
jgi:ABC-type glycerol-3-phosphate transport system substrate-binding protein